MINPILALSPLDGRYATSLDTLRPIFSEYGLMKARVKVELAWLKSLAQQQGIHEVPPFSELTLTQMDAIVADFSESDATEIKAIEATTNHDVKAIEYWLKQHF